MAADDFIVVGRLAAPFGVQGWLKVVSFTDPPDNLLGYQPWHVKARGSDSWQALDVAAVKAHQDGWVVRITGINDRDEARARHGNSDLAVPRSLLPEPEDNAVYWHDLVGLTVTTAEGVCLGAVVEMIATGANDVLVVRESADQATGKDGKRKERLLPYIDSVVLTVDLAAGAMTVAWDPDF